MKGKYLITTDEWFIAPDGKSYRAAWGECEPLADSFLGLKTNARSTNWYVKVGSEENHIIIAGCQIHYAIRCEKEPEAKTHGCEEIHEGKILQVEARTKIYIAQ